MSYSVSVDLSQWDALSQDLMDKLGSFAEAVVGFMEDYTIPQLESESASQRNVITGTYSGTWQAEAQGDDEVDVTTNAYYWVYLEYGTSRGIKPKMVVGAVVASMPGDLVQYLTNYLTEPMA